MQVATGTVVNGKIEVEGVSLPEGAIVAVVARGADEPFALSPEDEDELKRIPPLRTDEGRLPVPLPNEWIK